MWMNASQWNSSNKYSLCITIIIFDFTGRRLCRMNQAIQRDVLKSCSYTRSVRCGGRKSVFVEKHYKILTEMWPSVIDQNTTRAAIIIADDLPGRPAAPPHGPESSTAGQVAPAGGEDGREASAKSQRFIRVLISTVSMPVWKMRKRKRYFLWQ